MLEGYNILSNRYELQVIRGYCYVAQDTFFLKNASDESRCPGNQEKGIVMFLRLSSVSFDLILRNVREGLLQRERVHSPAIILT